LFTRITKMSRIGKQLIDLPSGVSVVISDSNVLVKGPKGELSREFHPRVIVTKEGNRLKVQPKPKQRRGDDAAIWGLSRALLFNMVKGVSEGYIKQLEIQGVGYRAQMQGKSLVLFLGFSHQINFPIPDGIDIKVEGNAIELSGIDKELVGQTAAKIRALRKPEPYKGKGIRYKDEHVKRKVGKKAAATAK